MSAVLRVYLWDASALVKLVVPEVGSKAANRYFGQRGFHRTTHFCVYETFNVLKRKWLKGDQSFDYDKACLLIQRYLTTNKISLCKTDVLNDGDLLEAYKLREAHNLDYSDALLLIDMKQGFTGSAGGESKATLLTADTELGGVAKEMGLKVSCLLDLDP